MAADLTPGELSECKEVFSMFDRDGDGTIDAEELEDALSFLGLNFSEDDLGALMEQIDSDKSGTIDFDEFLAVLNSEKEKGVGVGVQSPDELARKQSEEEAEEQQKIFDLIDKDQDGRISMEDLVTTVTECMPNEAVSDEDFERMMKVLGNHRDTVDFALYQKIMRQAS